jgi:heptaprenyl diphosphate synthase
MRRTELLETWISPKTRLVWGLLLILTLSVSASWPTHAFITVEGFVLARLAGKRVSLLYFSFLTLSITLFQIFVPFGRVLLRLGSFALTEGALSEGLLKGVTLSGLVFLSLAAVSKNLVFPGRLGALWGKTFAYYERLLEVRKSLNARNLFSSLDTVLETQFPTQGSDPVLSQPSERIFAKTTLKGWLIVAGTSLVSGFLAVWLR